MIRSSAGPILGQQRGIVFLGGWMGERKMVRSMFILGKSVPLIPGRGIAESLMEAFGDCRQLDVRGFVLSAQKTTRCAGVCQ